MSKKIDTEITHGDLTIHLNCDGSINVTAPWNDGEKSATVKANENGSWFEIRTV
jgi:hypothetical protein